MQFNYLIITMTPETSEMLGGHAHREAAFLYLRGCRKATAVSHAPPNGSAVPGSPHHSGNQLLPDQGWVCPISLENLTPNRAESKGQRPEELVFSCEVRWRAVISQLSLRNKFLLNVVTLSNMRLFHDSLCGPGIGAPLGWVLCCHQGIGQASFISSLKWRRIGPHWWWLAGSSPLRAVGRGLPSGSCHVGPSRARGRGCQQDGVTGFRNPITEVAFP